MMITDEMVEAGAKAMHARFEERAWRRHYPGYKKQGWDEIREKDRVEFREWAECALDALEGVTK